MNHLNQTVVKGLTRFAKTPYLTGSIGTMTTKYRQECAILKHTGIQLTISHISHSFIIITLPEPLTTFFSKESTNIDCPIRTSRSHKVQSRRNHPGKRVPGSIGIAIPRNSRITLLPGITGAGQINHTLV